MGKSGRSSRKGKKEWRANISTADVDDFIEKSTNDVLSGGSLKDTPSESLFFLDKLKGVSLERKIVKRRDKVLRCDSILQKNPFVQPLPASQAKHQSKLKRVPTTVNAIKALATENNISNTKIEDIWDNEGGDVKKSRKISVPSAIPAVEVDPAGCSFNPSFEAHQDSLAQAVAKEMQTIYQNELGPEPIPLRVPGQAIDEESMYFIEAGGDGDDTPEENSLIGTDCAQDKRMKKIKRVTRVELNKRARCKERERKAAEERLRVKPTNQIDSLADIMNEITKEDTEKEKRRIRRVVARQERLKTCPPRLGKHKFEPLPAEVLLSEEITGSLRKLKGCCTLARDRYKSFQKRGLLAPTAKKQRF